MELSERIKEALGMNTTPSMPESMKVGNFSLTPNAYKAMGFQEAEERASKERMSHVPQKAPPDVAGFMEGQINKALEPIETLVSPTATPEQKVEAGMSFGGIGGIVRARPYFHGTRTDFPEHEGGLIFLAEDASTAEGYALGGGGQRASKKISLIHDYETDRTLSVVGEDEWGYLKVKDPKTKETFVYDTDLESYIKEGVEPFSGEKYTKEFDFSPEYRKWLKEAQPMHKESLQSVPEGANIRRYYPDTEKTLSLKHQGYDRNRNPINEGASILAGIDPKGNTWASRIVNEAKKGNFDWSTTKYPEAQKAWKDVIIPQLKAKGYDSIEYWDDMHPTLAVFDNKQLKTSIPSLKTQDPQVQNDSLLFAARMLEKNGKMEEAAILRSMAKGKK